jgi:hypothetical protein
MSFAQQRGDITINWKPTKPVSYGDFEITMPQFDLKIFSSEPILAKLSTI